MCWVDTGPVTQICETILGLVPTNQFTVICKSREEVRSQLEVARRHTQVAHSFT